MATIYKGTELKFKVELTANGFSMAENDFEVEVKSGKTSVTLAKEDLIVNSGDYYGIVPTDTLAPGEVKLVATAHIPDSDADDGVRNEVAVTSLCTLVKP
jgi:hypothetical protein